VKADVRVYFIFSLALSLSLIKKHKIHVKEQAHFSPIDKP
jgi:hypothetical protein